MSELFNEYYTGCGPVSQHRQKHQR